MLFRKKMEHFCGYCENGTALDDGQLLANIADNLYLMEEVAEHELVSKEFDAPQEAPKKEKKKYIPPMDHPWRKASFANYAAKQKHRCGANV